MANAMEGMLIDHNVLIKYTGDDEELVLPDTIVRISPYAFSGCKYLKRITTPIKLKSIGKGAFYGCTGLEYALIPGRLFKRAKSGNVFPEGQNIYFRFYATNSANINDIDYSDEYGSEEAFLASGIDDSSQFDDEGEYKHANVVENANVGEVSFAAVTDSAEDSEHGGESAFSLGEDLILPDGDLDDRTLQERIEDITPEEEEKEKPQNSQSLMNLGDYLIEGDTVIKYMGSAIETEVPEFIRHIGDDAFANTDVEKVILPGGIETIGKNAFAWCCYLTEINFHDGLTLIDDGAFANCQALETVTFPETLKYIGADAFRACSALKEADIPSSVTAIGRRAFDFCIALERSAIPEGITAIADGVYSHCESLTQISFPSTLKTIGAWAFAECYALKVLNLPEGLESIGEVAFMNCRSLVAFDLPETLQSLGRQAFIGCDSLHLVTVPPHLEKQIKPSKAFHKLDSLMLVVREEKVDIPIEEEPSDEYGDFFPTEE